MVLIVFVAAAILTPPDVVTQIMLALPMWLLFELTLLLQRVLERNRQHQTDAKDASA